MSVIVKGGGGGSKQLLNGVTLKAKVIESNVKANTWGELVIDDAEATTEYINPAGDAEFVVSNIIPGTTDEVYLVKRTDRTVNPYNQTSVAIARAKVLEKSYNLISPWQTLEKSYFTAKRNISTTGSTSATLPVIGHIFEPLYRNQVFALASNKIVILFNTYALTGVYDPSAGTFTFSTVWISADDSIMFNPLCSDIFLSSDSSEIVGIAIQRIYTYSQNIQTIYTYSIGVTLAGESTIAYNSLGFKSGFVVPEESVIYTEHFLPINREQRIYGSSYNVIQFNNDYTSYQVLKANKNGALLVDISNSKYINRKYYSYINYGIEGYNTLPSSIPMSKHFTNFLPNDLQGHNGKVIYLMKRNVSLTNLPNPYNKVSLECYIVVDYSNLDAPIIVEEFIVPEKYTMYHFAISSNSHNHYIHNIVRPFNSNKIYIMVYTSRWDLPDSNYLICGVSAVSNMPENCDAKTVGIVRIMEYDLTSGKIKLLPFIRGLSAQSINTKEVPSTYDFGFFARLLPYLNNIILYVSAMGCTVNSNQVYPDKDAKIIDFNNFAPYKFAPLGYNDINKYYPREKALVLESGAIGDDIKIAFGGY